MQGKEVVIIAKHYAQRQIYCRKKQKTKIKDFSFNAFHFIPSFSYYLQKNRSFPRFFSLHNITYAKEILSDTERRNKPFSSPKVTQSLTYAAKVSEGFVIRNTDATIV